MHWPNQESFQNEVIRVILKNLNPILLLWVGRRPTFIKRWHSRLPMDQKKELIWQLLRQTEVKHHLLGMFIGQLDHTQLQEYLAHENDYKKRIIALLEKRLLDQIDYWK